MEYANDEVFKIRYNTKMNRLEMRKERWTSKFFKAFKSHKFLSTTIMAVIIFSGINIIMIYNFIEILQKI